jgi:hypothetical protein
LELQGGLRQEEVIQLLTPFLKVEKEEVEPPMEAEEDLVLLSKMPLLMNTSSPPEAVEEGEEELKTLELLTLDLMQEIFLN